MKDRIPTPGQEGRMLIKPENGDPPFYAAVEMADNPSEDGTPLNKETLLKDATAALFGLDHSAIPDDMWIAIRDEFYAKPDIIVGSYVGTGTYGESNPNTLTFDGEVKLLLISGYALTDDSMSTVSTVWLGVIWKGNQHPVSMPLNQGEYRTLAAKFHENTVSWYGSESVNQMNAANKTYDYIAFVQKRETT